MSFLVKAIEKQLTYQNRVLDVSALISFLAPYVSEERKMRIETILAHRTRTILPVMENLQNKGNLNAILRTADALGFQSVHSIRPLDSLQQETDRVSMGAEKWIHLQEWNSTTACVQFLRQNGYRIVATHLDETAKPLNEIDFTRPTALIFGNEKEGISSELLQHADMRCMIPMYGFVQSYNISVAAAIALYHIVQDRFKWQKFHGDLLPEEKMFLTALFYKKSVKHYDALIKHWVELNDVEDKP